MHMEKILHEMADWQHIPSTFSCQLLHDPITVISTFFSVLPLLTMKLLQLFLSTFTFFLSHVFLRSLIPGVCTNVSLSSTIFNPDTVLNFCHFSVKLVTVSVGFKLYASFTLAVEGQAIPTLNKVKEVRTAGDIRSVRACWSKINSLEWFLKEIGIGRMSSCQIRVIPGELSVPDVV